MVVVAGFFGFLKGSGQDFYLVSKVHRVLLCLVKRYPQIKAFIVGLLS